MLPLDCLLGYLVVLVAQVDTQSTYSPSLHRIWNTRRVPYILEESLNDSIKTAFITATEVLEAHGCVKFEVKSQWDIDFLHVTSGDSCETVVGKLGGEQILRLSQTCGDGIHFDGEVLHELMHTLGFYHEHQRLIRNSYITVHIDQVQISKRGNFDRKYPLSPRINALSYDYDSITHYGPKEFSVDDFPTIETRDPSKADLIGQRTHLSSLDILKLNMYYNCENSTMVDHCSPLPNSFQHGSYTTVQGEPNKIGQIVQYTCDAGRVLVGPEFRNCQLDGQWLAYEPLCLIPLHYCNFDDGSWCEWNQSYFGAKANYLRLQSIGTEDIFTGPEDDYTTMASNGLFCYAESSEAGKDDIAKLTSPNYELSGHMCFKFAYSMYGQTIGDLNVYLLKDQERTQIFSKTGGQGPQWNTFTYQFPSDISQVQVEIEFKMKGQSRGDVAIDDLLVVECTQLGL